MASVQLKKLFPILKKFSKIENVPAMLYPNELLPKSNYNKFEIEDLPGNYFLLRKSKNPPQSKSDDVRVDEIYSDGKDLFGLSNNLVGIYKIEHLKCVPIKDEKNYNANWNEGDPVLEPKDIVWEIDERASPIFLPIEHLHNAPFPYDKPKQIKGEKQLVTQSIVGVILVKHFPTKCNFWHFEFLVKEGKEEGGKEIKRNKVSTNDWRDDAAKSLLKITLKNIAKREIHPQEIFDIPAQVYCAVA